MCRDVSAFLARIFNISSVNTYTGESHDDTQRDEQTDMSTRRYRDQHRGNDRHQNADTEHVLAAVA